MSPRTSAARYAKALFEVALQESDPARVEQDLAGIVRAMQEHPDLRRALTSPGVPPAARAKLVATLADRGGAQPVVRKLLVLLAERARLELLPVLLEVYRERLLAHANIVRAQVTSAMPLGDGTRRALQDRLGSVTGKRVELETAVDASLIGGLVTRIGSIVYDGSIRTQLARMRREIVEGVR